MAKLPPFRARLIAPDGFEDPKYFETKAAAIKWALGEGKEQFDGDIERAEIWHPEQGLVWSKGKPKIEEDVRYKQMRDPNSWLAWNGIPQPRPRPDVESFCENCQRKTMNWPTYEKWCGLLSKHKLILECYDCRKTIPGHSPRDDY